MDFVRREHADLLRFFTWKVKCPSAAADLVQDLYLRIVTLTKPQSIATLAAFCIPLPNDWRLTICGNEIGCFFGRANLIKH